MAITATLTVNPAAVQSPQQLATVTLTLSNSLATTVNVTGVVPYAAAGAGGTIGSVPVLLGMPPIGPGQPMTIPATGANLVMTWTVAAVAPPQATYAINPFGQGSYPGGAAITPLVPLANPSSQVIALGATVYTADGSITIPATVNLTVTGLAAA